jgi:hypothetical protein
MSVVTLQEALHVEAKEAIMSLEEMMKEMLGNVEEGGGNVPIELDDFTIRRMLLARDYLKKDIKKMDEMKKAIIADWDRRISKKKEQVEAIEGIVSKYIKEQNGGHPLQFDVATASMRKVPQKIEIKDEIKVRQYLQEEGKLESFLKPAELDKTLLKDHMMKQLMEKVEEEAQKRIQQEIEASEKKKISKKREKEIHDQVLAEMTEQLKVMLPEGFEYIAPSETLSIRSNL